MQYITDEHKNITHVLVPIDEWNSMLEKQGADDSPINPYQPAIEWIESILEAKSPTGKIPPLVGLTAKMAGQDLYANMPAYNVLRTVLENKALMAGGGAAMNKFGGLGTLLSLMYPSVLQADTKTVAVMYIIRNDEFYTALGNTEEGISTSDATVLAHYGFDVKKFKREAEPELLNVLYGGDKSEFVFAAMGADIGSFFKLSPIKERVRREPEQLRIFFYDLFEALDEILIREASLNDVFKKYPLVDKLAKAVYPSNTLSGSTSRVYKAAKEARTIIANDWQKYVSVSH